MRLQVDRRDDAAAGPKRTQKPHKPPAQGVPPSVGRQPGVEVPRRARIDLVHRPVAVEPPERYAVALVEPVAEAYHVGLAGADQLHPLLKVARRVLRRGDDRAVVLQKEYDVARERLRAFIHAVPYAEVPRVARAANAELRRERAVAVGYLVEEHLELVRVFRKPRPGV